MPRQSGPIYGNPVQAARFRWHNRYILPETERWRPPCHRTSRYQPRPWSRLRARRSRSIPQLELAKRPDVVLVDIRDPRELEREGKVPGATSCPRGMLEFWIDPASPYYKPVFGQDKQYVFFCAGGMRSVLATKIAQDMGLKPVAHIIGGFGAWKAAGGAVEKTEKA
jgi:rhodanese-related sulfurtransferase